MTKKDYELIANRIRKTKHLLHQVFTPKELNTMLNGIRWLEGELAQGLKQDNPKFDGIKFREACQLIV